MESVKKKDLYAICAKKKPSNLVSPREKPSLWTSQTFSDPYQACSAAICSSVFTWWTERTRRKVSGQQGLIVTQSLSETASISSLIPAMCWQVLREKLVKMMTMQGDEKWTWRSHSPLSTACSFRVFGCEKFQTRRMSKYQALGVCEGGSTLTLVTKMPGITSVQWTQKGGRNKTTIINKQ